MNQNKRMGSRNETSQLQFILLKLSVFFMQHGLLAHSLNVSRSEMKEDVGAFKPVGIV